ncbi:LysR family transcriptional regulator [Comamonas piscis]|uniref:LysR family transcriptional regulator n=1 Tax=Comamonas piscis TaxID=1562974 RepID=A0A7G5ECD9_9BURK|nr:LysR family transcriptional regulator [Comamonas piscis]QMV71664.1 LysR family transcriptional regulator [Comamonas piscis]WSO34385.1 LysR family transcriptional regulator [Comamonas piscis]
MRSAFAPFDSDTIQTLLAVLDHGSFSAAARALGKVPSAVSMQIAQLEAELQMPLFARVGREPTPLPAALALEPQARLLAAQLQQLNAHALALEQGLESRLTVAIAPELVSAPWAAPLAALAQEYPQLAVEVLTAPQADALTMLHSGRAQLALVFERPSLDGREGFQEVATETLLAVIAPSHPLMQSLDHAPPPGEATRPQLREHHLTNTRQIIVASRDWSLSHERLVYARDVWRTDNHAAALQMVSAGIGWGWLPQPLVAPLLQSGALVAMEFANLSNGAQLYVDVVWSKEHPMGLAAKRFVALVQAASQAPPSAETP